MHILGMHKRYQCGEQKYDRMLSGWGYSRKERQVGIRVEGKKSEYIHILYSCMK
jgi:hypothetical protein